MGGEFGSLLVAVATFGVGFFTRPLGGVLIGAFADRAGRKPAMILTVALITVGTLGLAATPSYASIGIAAPIIVVFCRLLQGLALGGEVGPATSLLIEAAPAGRRGFYSSWQIASQGLAVAVGGVFGVTLSLRAVAGATGRLGLARAVPVQPGAGSDRDLHPPQPSRNPRRRQRAQRRADRRRRVSAAPPRAVCWACFSTASTAVASQVGNYMVTYAVQVLKLPAALAQGSVLMETYVTERVVCRKKKTIAAATTTKPTTTHLKKKKKNTTTHHHHHHLLLHHPPTHHGHHCQLLSRSSSSHSTSSPSSGSSATASTRSGR